MRCYSIFSTKHRISNSVGVPELAICICSAQIRQLVYTGKIWTTALNTANGIVMTGKCFSHGKYDIATNAESRRLLLDAEPGVLCASSTSPSLTWLSR